MSIVWQRRRGDTRYEVRRAGNTLRLYTNGVLHTQYNRRRALTGSVWDLLVLPAFLVDPGRIQRVLVLGAGGGAAIHLLRHFVQPAAVVAVDCNAVHLEVARRFFAVDGDDVTLVRDDAVRWLRAYRGPAFDMIIDDLFADADGLPERAVPVTARWSVLLLRHLADGGLVVANFPTRGELAGCAFLRDARVRARVPSAFRLSTPQNDNAVGVFCGSRTSARRLRERLQRTPALDPRRARIRYRIRTLSG